MPALSQQLGQCLDAELSALRDLETALEDEHSALTENDLERLEDATQRKQQAVAAQQHSQRQRGELLRGGGMAEDLRLSELVRHLRDNSRSRDAHAPAAAAIGEQLIDLASRCQDLNRRNGGLILRQQDRTRQAIDVLRGAEESPHLYSLDGGFASSSDSRTLGKA